MTGSAYQAFLTDDNPILSHLVTLNALGKKLKKSDLNLNF